MFTVGTKTVDSLGGPGRSAEPKPPSSESSNWSKQTTTPGKLYPSSRYSHSLL